jgi:hypothetical protein
MSRTKSEMLSLLCEELDLTQMELARLCEVDPATVQRWLAGSHPIPMAVIRMCGLLELGRRRNMLPDCWPGDWSPPLDGAAIVGEAQSVAEAILADLVHVASTNTYWSYEVGCLIKGSAVNTRWTARMLEAGLLGTKTSTGKPSMTLLTPTNWLRRSEHLQKANDFVHRPGEPRFIDGDLNIASTVLEQVTAPPPPPRPEYREGLRLISAVLPSDPPPTAATSPFDSSAPIVYRRRRQIATAATSPFHSSAPIVYRRRRRIAPPED